MNTIGLQWHHDDNTVSLYTEIQTSNEEARGVDSERTGEVRLTPEQWLTHTATILEMLLGKPNEGQDGFIVGPVGADPGLIGDVIASKIQRNRDARNGTQ